MTVVFGRGQRPEGNRLRSRERNPPRWGGSLEEGVAEDPPDALVDGRTGRATGGDAELEPDPSGRTPVDRDEVPSSSAGRGEIWIIERPARGCGLAAAIIDASSLRRLSREGTVTA